MSEDEQQAEEPRQAPATRRPGGRVPDVTLKLPRPLYDRLSLVIEGTGFRSVTEFCVYVLRDLVAAQDAVPHEDELSHEDVDAVRRRLRALGYLED
jgi:hypothetical protein